MFSVLRNLLSVESPPTKVVEVKLDQYKSRKIYLRDDGIILYEPANDGKKQTRKYEIVLYRSCTESQHQAFSLFRSERRDEAEQRFTCFRDKVPALIEISKEMYSLKNVQSLCDFLIEYPTWNLAHLAAHFSLYDAFSHTTVNSLLNSSDPSTGMSPLMVASRTGNLKLVQLLVASKCFLEHLDYYGNTVFHYAASTTKEIISTLSQESPSCLNYCNKNGQTALHIACMADKPECVEALLLAGADVNISATQAANLNGKEDEISPGYSSGFSQDSSNKLNTQDMKFGGTVLHSSCSPKVIETLVSMGCNINALNSDQRTALHVMVMHNRLECVVILLSYEADPNIADNEGNTPLHLAVKKGSIPIVQALIVFGANIDYKNNFGSSPRHLVTQNDRILYLLHAVGAKRCDESVEACTKGCKHNEDFNGTPPTSPICQDTREVISRLLDVAGMEVAAKEERRKVKGGRLLCLDGGGIRGLVLIEMLLEMEALLDKPIQHCFDWITGTSTGGILALGLCSGKSLKECLCLYFRMKEHAFVGSRPYPSDALERILKETLGTETVMSDIKHPKVMITAVLADRKPVDLHLFRNYENPSQLLNVAPTGPFESPPSPSRQLLWQAARATGAAPSYFRAFGPFIDGGLIANNPTLDALTEIHEYNLALKAIGRVGEMKPVTAVVSLGTGLIPVIQSKEIDIFRPESIWDTAKFAIGVSKIGNLLVDQATCCDGRVVDRTRTWCSMIGVPYFRFTPQMSVEVNMDEKNDEILVNMLWETKAYMHANRASVKEMVAIITSD